MPSFRFPLALAFGALACWLVLFITEPPGPGLDPDSLSYVAAARSLVASGTLRVPEDDWESSDSTTALSHFPPGFPAAVAVPVALGMAPVQGARLVVALAALVMVTLAVWLLCAVESRTAGAMAAVALMATPALVDVHESVLSEPLFLALMVLTLALVVRVPRRPLAAGIAAAAAGLVRYAGVSLVGGVALWWLLSPGDRKTRWRSALLAVLPAVLALGAWVVRTSVAPHGAEIRQISVYGQIGPTLREGVGTVAAWLAPALDGVWRAIAAVSMLAALTAVFIAACRGRSGAEVPETPARRVLAASAVLAACYAAVVLLARLFADPGIPLDERLLAPFMLLVTVAAVVALVEAWRRWGRAARAAAAVLGMAWLAASASVVVDSVQYALETGNDYADVQWSGSPLVEWVRQHAAGRPLFTNFPTALYFHAGRMARGLPDVARPDVARAFTDTVASRGGLVIVFERATQFAPSPDSLLRLVPLRVVARTSDGEASEVSSSGAH